MEDAANESSRVMSFRPHSPLHDIVKQPKVHVRTFSTSLSEYICLAVRLDIQMGSISSGGALSPAACGSLGFCVAIVFPVDSEPEWGRTVDTVEQDEVGERKDTVTQTIED